MRNPDLTLATPATPLAAAALPADLLLLAAIWGASFLFMRVAANDFGPLPLVAVRLSLGALLLLPFLWQAAPGGGPRRPVLPLRLLPRLALVGLINSALPFVLFAWAAQRAPAGVGAITNSMAVLFTALVAFLFYGERIGRGRALALLAGFVGVAILASGRSAGASIGLAAAAGTLAALLYGFGANMIRRYLVGLPPAAVAAATLGSAALLVLPFALASWPDKPIAPMSWLSAAALGLLCTGWAYGLYYRLIARIGAARAVTVTYLVPLFALAWSWLLLGERPTPTMLLAGLVILASVALSQRQSG